MVIDHLGVVKLSSRADEVGAQISRNSPTCLVCHAKSAQSRQRWVLFREGGADVLRSVLPVENRPECHRCHDASSRMNGMIVLDVSLATVEAQFRRDVALLGIGTAVVTLLMLGGVGLYVRRLVLARLARLSQAVRAIAGGNLAQRADTAGDDVIASLAIPPRWTRSGTVPASSGIKCSDAGPSPASFSDSRAAFRPRPSRLICGRWCNE